MSSGFYHFHAKVISAKTGDSVSAKAAYRAGAILYEAHTDKIHDYSKKTGVIHTEIFLPQGWKQDYSRESLWNYIRSLETRSNSTLAREFEISLLESLDMPTNKKLIQEFTKTASDKFGFAADLCIHLPKARRINSDLSHDNPHAHILISTRDGANKKIRELDCRGNGLQELRKLWEEICNKELSKRNLPLVTSGKLPSIEERIKTIDLAIQENFKALQVIKKEKENEQRANTEHVASTNTNSRLQNEPKRKNKSFDDELIQVAYESEKEKQDARDQRELFVSSGTNKFNSDESRTLRDQQGNSKRKATNNNTVPRTNTGRGDRTRTKSNIGRDTGKDNKFRRRFKRSVERIKQNSRLHLKQRTINEVPSQEKTAEIEYYKNKLNESGSLNTAIFLYKIKELLSRFDTAQQYKLVTNKEFINEQRNSDTTTRSNKQTEYKNSFKLQ